LKALEDSVSEFSNEDDAFESIIKDALPDKMITNFVLIAEIYDDDGEELTVFMSDKMTPWLALGMLKSATQTVTSQSRSQFSGDD
jgi:hypothetical protein